MSNFEHYVGEDLWTDTASYSGAPHCLCKYEKPITNRERMFNAFAQIIRQRIESYHAWLHNNFSIITRIRSWLRTHDSTVA